MSHFAGNWKHEHSDHMDEFLQAMGINEAQRQIISKAHDSQKWTVNGDHFHVKHEGLRTYEYDFEVGKEYSHDFFGKEHVTFSTAKESDSKLIHHGKTSQGDITVTREVHGDHMHVTMEINGAHGHHKVVRTFKKE